MKRNIRLNGTDLIYASPIALGTVVAGAVYDVPTAFNIFDKYVDIGGNLFDTARVYSDWIPGQVGRSETVIGQWIKNRGHHDDIIICTKGGAPDQTSAEGMKIHRMKRADMRYDIELSLKTLGIDCIDMYFYHRDDGQSVEELIDIMETFRKEGKIKYYGCSNWKTDRIKEAAEYCSKNNIQGFSANQPMFNIGCQVMKPVLDPMWGVMDAGMQKFHSESGMACFAYFSNCSGFYHLLKKYGEQAIRDGILDTLDDSSQNGKMYVTEGCFEIGREVMRLCEEKNASITEVMMNYFLTLDFPCFPLFGATEAAHLDDFARIDELGFTADDYAFVDRINKG